MSLSRRLPLLVLPFVAYACSSSPKPIVATPIPVLPMPPPATHDDTTPAPVDPPPAPILGVDENALDKSVDPCNDFYEYACGGWMKATPIPEDRPAWTRSFSEIDERNQTKLRAVLDGIVSGKIKGTPETTKLGDFYGACMDEAGIEKAGLEPLKPAFAVVDAITDAKSIGVAVRELYRLGFHPLVAVYSGQDFGDATQVIGQVEQAGLGLPDRDYYLDKDKKQAAIRAAYEVHVAKMLSLAGEPEAGAAAKAKTILAFETELAKASMTRVDRRDPKKVYHRMLLPDVQKLAPTFGWDGFMAGVAVDKAAPINVAQPGFVKAMETQVKKAKPEDWKTYLRFHVISEHAAALPKAFVDEDFKFRSENLTGSKTILPRWKRCVAATDGALGELLAQPFVRENFGAEGKAKTLSMVSEIEKAMERDLTALPWMDDATRKKAFEKLQKIKNKIGYPDTWRNYDALVVEKAQYAKNVLAAEGFELKRVMAKIGKPLDRGEWYMTPPTVNAYYDANMNEMVFPAGILQPPFFDRKMSEAMNYGAIGMVMGHELTHGFDDEGRQFDGDGNLKEWWSKKVSKEFDKRAACVVKQFDDFVAIDDLHVNGKLTLGENIADLGGLKLAYVAYVESRKGKEKAPINGFSEEQQFFIGYAQGWCQNARPQYRRTLTKTDPHSPPPFRVKGPVSNMPEFAAAFSCKEGAKMVRSAKDRCEVW